MEKVTIKDFPELDLGDVRRDQRFVTIIDNIIKQPACSIPQQNGGWYETKAAYQFFRNEDVTPEGLQKIILAPSPPCPPFAGRGGNQGTEADIPTAKDPLQ